MCVYACIYVVWQMCACVWCATCVCVFVYVYMCVMYLLCHIVQVSGLVKLTVYSHVEASNWLRVYLYDSPYILRRCFLLNLKLCVSAIQSSDQAQGSPYSPSKVVVEDWMSNPHCVHCKHCPHWAPHGVFWSYVKYTNMLYNEVFFSLSWYQITITESFLKF